MRLSRRCVATAALGTTMALALGACAGTDPESEGDPADVDTDAPVTITVGNLAPTENPESRENLLAMVEEFEADHPNITVEPEETTWSSDTFIPMLQGGTLPTTLEIPFTEIQALIGRGQVYDLTDLVAGSEALSQLDPSILATVQDSDGNIYGVPYQAYTMGLVYHRGLFTEAGLDPDSPPTTWEEVREAAQQITENTDATGFATMTTDNTGGWTLSTLSYAFGGAMEEVDDDGNANAIFADTGATAEALEFYRTLRWEDESMGANFLMNQDDIMNDLGAGQLAMTVNGADSYGNLVVNRGLAPEDFGVAGLPQSEDALGTLAGGAIAMVSPNATPEEAAAALEWIEFVKFQRYLNEDAAVEFASSRAADDLPVYPPLLPVLGGEVEEQYTEWIAEYINAPVEQFEPYTSTIADIPLVPEPPVKAQELYATLDAVVQAVLTEEDADIDTLLSEAQTSVQQQIDAG
ncbi:extracellular solute-binding protein [Ruania rhizosphaerae]|uniref:extracellular solute-binding protein n=1 Tax=Ruania rhizosphaerae TaxID=1840413 RepID=UPI0013597C50|nr:extracellular solute-binding protein [Ruania rhizosphaerae]